MYLVIAVQNRTKLKIDSRYYGHLVLAYSFFQDQVPLLNFNRRPAVQNLASEIVPPEYQAVARMGHGAI